MNTPGITRPKLSYDGQFTLVPNDWIRKSGLSPAANLLLIYFISHEIGYQIKFPQIKRETRIGDKLLRSSLKELVEAGWLELERERRPDGKLGIYCYNIKEPELPLEYEEVTTMPQATLAQATMAQGSHLKREIKTEDKSLESPAKAERATRVKQDFEPSPENLAKMQREFPNFDLKAETDKFIDYWLAQPGGKKLDWQATWRNWIRNSAKRSGVTQQKGHKF